MQLPEILFGNSYLKLAHVASGTSLVFTAQEALQQWMQLFKEDKFEVIKVPEAEGWQRRPMADQIKREEYDWTWGTDYPGSLHSDDKESSEEGRKWCDCEESGMDMELLQDQSTPITMYDEVTLFQDFIHDHGFVELSAKIRIMPQFWYVLLRYWLRVDGVLMKVIDTRVYHNFDSASVFRTTSQKSVKWGELRGKGGSEDPKQYKDSRAAGPYMSSSEEPRHQVLQLK
ncbi:unnamed protein product [Chrysoparadoxa australica]